jgi:hypothetical protein
MNSQDFTSTDLISYCNYIRTWEDEIDGNIDKIIAEHRALRAVPNDDPTAAVSDVEACPEP